MRKRMTILLIGLMMLMLIVPVDARDKFTFGVPDDDTEWFYDGPNVRVVRHSRHDLYNLLLGPEYAHFQVAHDAEVNVGFNDSIYAVEMNLFNFSIRFNELRFENNGTLANETMLHVRFYNETPSATLHEEFMGIGNRTTIESPATWRYDQQMSENNIVYGDWPYRFNITTDGEEYRLETTISFVYDIHFENRYVPPESDPIVVIIIGIAISAVVITLIVVWKKRFELRRWLYFKTKRGTK